MKPSYSIARIDLPFPRFNPDDHFFTAEVLARARRHFESFVSRYHICVHRRRSGFDGKADSLRLTIWVPEIKNLGDFWVAMHEVGHVVASPRTLRTTVCELIQIKYEAEIFALEQCQALGLSTEYERHGKRNVFKYAKRAHTAKIAWLDLPQPVCAILTDWLGIRLED